MIGLVVDSRYRIERRLARGGMATVYVAHDERLERPVALKLMHPHLAESADFVQRFRREARSAARILHPGVVSVFDQGVVHGQGFLVMELVDGPNLRTLLRRQGAFTLEQSLRYTRDVLDALRAAHRVGVVHRDIKPENVLVPADPPVRVTDFGLARAASEVSMSTTGTMLGTIAYIAPEVASSGGIDARTDLYAVGIMAYEMLTGHVPWEGENALQIAQHHVNDSIPLPSESEPWIPREVDDLIASLAARNPDERPQDADHALDLVARVIAAIPADVGAMRAEVEPQESGTQTVAWSSRGATTALPARIPATSETIVHASGHVPAPMEHPSKTKSRVGKILALIALLLIAGGLSAYWWWNAYGPGSYLTMPQTTGRSASAVESDLKAMGLEVLIEENFSDTVAKGVVIETDPAGGELVHRDADVRLIVSLGVDMRTVPSLVGMAKDEAVRVLTAEKLAVGTTSTEYSEEVGEGLVISQSIDADESVPHDTRVDIVVSKGREPLKVPDLSEMTAERARAAIEALGLIAKPTEAFSDSIAAGSVISQETAADTVLHKGDEVAYTVSKGPETVQVPDVTGKSESEATLILESAGFEVRVARVLGGVFGTARYTDPEAGSSARKGSVITLYVV